MNELQIFNNEKYGEIRTAIINNEPYFMLADVCRVLEIVSPTRTKERLNKNGVHTMKVIDNLNREQQATFINESNLYKLAFTSRKKEAEEFTEWVTSEVLPSIRKHGGYLTPAKIEEVLSNPDTIIKLATELKQERAKRIEHEQKIEADKPKVLFAEAVETAKSSILVGELAKLIKQNGIDIGQQRLFNFMRENGYLIKQKGSAYNMPTQKSMNLGLFEIKERTINHSDHVEIVKTPKVTGKGQIYFINMFAKSKMTA